MKKKSESRKPRLEKIELPAKVGTEDRVFDYKDVAFLSKFVSERGRIAPRSRTGLTAQEQRKLAQAVKRARSIALMPFAN